MVDQHPHGPDPAGSETLPRLVVHVVDALGSGHGLLNVISHLPPERYRHAIVCLDDPSLARTDPALPGVDIVRLPRARAAAALAPGRALRPLPPLLPSHYLHLFRVLRRLRPDLVHTRDSAGLWAQAVAALAGVRLRVHAEAGGAPGRRRTGLAVPVLRRLVCPLVDHFIAASGEVERWLVDSMGAAPARVSRIAHGVDSVQFHPRLGPAAALGPPGFMRDGAFVVGSAGRMDEAGNHATLVDVFLRLIASPHPAHSRLRLLIAGDGPVRAECMALLQRAGAADRAWLPGERADLPQLLRAMDVFVQPSLREGASHLILEAMASGLPVVAGAVGAHAELVHPGFTGILVPPQSVELMASAIADYCRIPDMAIRHGARARSQVIARHSMPAMARDLLAIYDGLSCDDDDDAWRVA